jgi:hypothetical protein
MLTQGYTRRNRNYQTVITERVSLSTGYQKIKASRYCPEIFPRAIYFALLNLEPITLTLSPFVHYPARPVHKIINPAAAIRKKIIFRVLPASFRYLPVKIFIVLILRG